MSGNAAESNLNATTPSTLMASVTTEISSAAALAIDPLSHVGDGIFLQTKTAQGIAGVCVWVALFLTCQQVCTDICVIRLLLSNHCYHYCMKSIS